MGYEAALEKAWVDLVNLKGPNNLSVRFMADEYALDCQAKQILSLACNVSAKDFVSILILHYLVQKSQGLPQLANQWLTFREFSHVEGYAAAFRERAIKPIIRKYSQNPDALKDVLKKLPGRLGEGGDISIIIEAFVGIPVLIKLWKQDSEFGPDANIYFDANIEKIFCTEDIVVLAQLVANQL